MRKKAPRRSASPKTSKPAMTSEARASNEILLLKKHTHAGEQYAAGETITVGDAEARWIINHGIGQVAGHTTPTE